MCLKIQSTCISVIECIYMYLVMEYCSGGDLFMYLQLRDFELPEKRAAQIMQQICVAVFYMHSYGIIHRDLKPENILMTDETDEACPKILDFGLSKLLNPGDECSDSHGTIVSQIIFT
jgi:serine/threonine protein kinase